MTWVATCASYPKPPIKEGEMECPDCGTEMGDPVDTTYSNIKTARAEVGQHTGDIYWCEICEVKWIDDYLNHKFDIWHG